MNGKRRSFLISRPARHFVREARTLSGFSFFDLLHGYFYARWPYLYIGVGTGEHRLAKKYQRLVSWISKAFSRLNRGGRSNAGAPSNGKRTFADGYHGKVMPLESVSRLVMVGEEIKIPDLEQVIPYPRSRALILQNPDHIVALQCPCRTARQNPCLPLDVCLIVGEPFAGLVMQHHAGRARWVDREQALEILHQEDSRGHVHHAFFKDAMLERFYAICNCCSCCCGAMQAHSNGTPMLASSGYVCQVDDDLCIGCGDCREYCQFEALVLEGPGTRVDAARCMGCGVCVDKCAQGALSLERDPARGEPLEILQLLANI